TWSWGGRSRRTILRVSLLFGGESWGGKGEGGNAHLPLVGSVADVPAGLAVRLGALVGNGLALLAVVATVVAVAVVAVAVAAAAAVVVVLAGHGNGDGGEGSDDDGLDLHFRGGGCSVRRIVKVLDIKSGFSVCKRVEEW